MGSSWTGDVEDSPDEDEDEETLDFKDLFAQKVEAGDVEDITVSDLSDLDSVDDADIIREAKEQDTRTTTERLYDARLDTLTEEVNDDMTSEPSESQQTQSDSSPGEVEDESSESDDEMGRIENEETAVDDSDETSSSTSVDISSIAPDAMDVNEAADKTHKWRVMVWGPPGLFKTHFAYTMPSPVVMIDTEGKADDIASKFRDAGDFDDPFIFQPNDYDEADEALTQALALLDEFHDKTGQTGTIVVDSMSIMWEWSKQKYVDEFYPNKDDASDVDFSSNMGASGQSDWKMIKKYHNQRFRRRMLNSPYHLCWTAMATEDYGAVMEGNSSGATPMKPDGEKDNEYKVDHIIRARDADGMKVGDMTKSGLVNHYFMGLELPTFPKLESIVDTIRDAEETDESVSIPNELDYDVTVTNAPPKHTNNDE